MIRSGLPDAAPPLVGWHDGDPILRSPDRRPSSSRRAAVGNACVQLSTWTARGKHDGSEEPMNDLANTCSPPAASVETIGRPSGKFHVELSTRFLEHFSEQLYSSPQKAFEELISNGWDAGADCVDVRISTNLRAANATLSVLDNGASMDEAGLRQLWHIAFSPKKTQSGPIRPASHRQVRNRQARHLCPRNQTHPYLQGS